MGVITKLNLNELNNITNPLDIKIDSFKKTKHGITDTTYILNDIKNTNYVLKLYEASSKEEVLNEIEILKVLKNLKVPRVISSKIDFYKNKPIVLYSCIEGKIPKEINIKQIEEITLFTASLHRIDFKPVGKNIYTKAELKNMLDMVFEEKDKKIKNSFLKKYEKIKTIDMSSNTLIHGDLFPDNCKFIDDRLSGVYDFSQSCFGNSYFDLSVLTLSWCFKSYEFNFEFLDKILNTYNENLDKNITQEILRPYLLYGCLYYALQRYSRENRLKDFNEFLIKFEIIEEIIK